MRVAVIGGNLLGTACAFYVHRALKANREEEEQQSQSPQDEVVLFEKESQLGGTKLRTISSHNQPVPIGTAAEFDLRFLPAFRTLCNQAGLPLPAGRRREWTIFDWDKDEYRGGQVGSKICRAVRHSFFCSALLQAALLMSLVWFVTQWNTFRIGVFVRLDRDDDPYVDLGRVVWALFVAAFAGGLLPVAWMLRVYDWVFFKMAGRITAQMTYGGYSLDMLQVIRKQIVDHVQIILDNDSASSCISVLHLLAACGMRKYATQRGSELLAKVQMGDSVIKDMIDPQLQFLNVDSKTGVADCNALQTMLALARCKWGGSGCVVGDLGTGVCERILEGVAEIRVGCEVGGVKVVKKGEYEVLGKDGSSLGNFDGVVVACHVGEEFETDVVEDVKEAAGVVEQKVRMGVNVAKQVAVVKGSIKAGYFKKGKVKDMAEHISVLGSVSVMEVGQFGEVWRIVGGGGWREHVFEQVEKVDIVERRFCDREEGDLIWGERMLYTAGVKSVGGGVEMDVLAGRNCGSLFRRGVAEWK